MIMFVPYRNVDSSHSPNHIPAPVGCPDRTIPEPDSRAAHSPVFWRTAPNPKRDRSCAPMYLPRGAAASIFYLGRESHTGRVSGMCSLKSRLPGPSCPDLILEHSTVKGVAGGMGAHISGPRSRSVLQDYLGRSPRRFFKARRGEARRGLARQGTARQGEEHGKENGRMRQTTKMAIKGVTPLLLHNGMIADPLNPATQELKKVSGKRTKTTQDHMDMARLEWFAGLYTDEKDTIVIPGVNIEKALIQAARKSKKGKQFESGVSIFQDVPLDFPDRGKPLEKLYECGNYTDRRMVVVQRNRVARTRAKFLDWSLSFEVDFDNELVNESDLFDTVELAGQMIGIGDYRPRFGRFELNRDS